MPRELTSYDDELTDPEACYRRGFQHSAAAVLQLVAGKLEARDARRISQWVGRICGIRASPGMRLRIRLTATRVGADPALEGLEKASGHRPCSAQA